MASRASPAGAQTASVGEAERAEVRRVIAGVYASLPDDPAAAQRWLRFEQPRDASTVVPALRRWAAAWRDVGRASSRQYGKPPSGVPAAAEAVSWPVNPPAVTDKPLEAAGKNALALTDPDGDGAELVFRRTGEGEPWAWDLSAQLGLKQEGDADRRARALDALAAAATKVAEQVAARTVRSADDVAPAIDREACALRWQRT